MFRNASIRLANQHQGRFICFFYVFPLITLITLMEYHSVSAAEISVKSTTFLYETAPFPSCHASTIAETADGLVAAFFGGTDEGENDVGIWLCDHRDGRWSIPRLVAEGIEDDGKRYPCWNPVLWYTEKGELLLFYKVGPRPDAWWGKLIRSSDQGKTWSKSERLPDGILGPVRNKPVLLKSNRLICGSSSEDAGWRAHMEWTQDDGRTWKRTEALNSASDWGLIQPTILRHPQGKLQILCRSREKKIVELWSNDQGETWSKPNPLDLPNPNSGIDGVTLTDGRHLLVYNHTQKGRSPLSVALSNNGRQWGLPFHLESEPGEFSYPAIIETTTGHIHVLYTWNRKKIRHVELTVAASPK